jgi:hypothetical protein
MELEDDVPVGDVLTVAEIADPVVRQVGTDEDEVSGGEAADVVSDDGPARPVLAGKTAARELVPTMPGTSARWVAVRASTHKYGVDEHLRRVRRVHPSDEQEIQGLPAGGVRRQLLMPLKG